MTALCEARRVRGAAAAARSAGSSSYSAHSAMYVSEVSVIVECRSFTFASYGSPPPPGDSGGSTVPEAAGLDPDAGGAPEHRAPFRPRGGRGWFRVVRQL
ncbi:hypothetical protein GCM10018793_05900 [Streptomyces sulfonofaciens]|uniref:Uncharacterized protein n=1 Tax=Streptomyces sulfonofaciens TaxID=68272 RepID=A0A919FR77_9ACTN|nr:hypothetical protein GCM10018793_05900 [Streptomyces sulfonofaciens]